MRVRLRVACLAALCAAMVCQSTFPMAQPASPPKAATADQTYILGPSDVIEVSVLAHPEFTTRGRIAEDGTVLLPYLGGVIARDQTTNELGEKVSRLLEKGGYFPHAIVKVDIVSYASRYVTVLGEVATPGLVPVDKAYRLSEIIAKVGGVKDSGADYVVLRPQHGPERNLTIKDLATGDEAQDPFVAPGDKIYSPKAEVFYVSGQVNAPGAYGLLPDMTVKMAIARGGGVTQLGSESRIQLTRRGVKQSHVDLNSKVEAGDILYIAERLF
jgi:polysaccharide export outer membrane protein